MNADGVRRTAIAAPEQAGEQVPSSGSAKKGEVGWLRENLTGGALLGVSVERSRAAMVSLFGKRAAHRGHPIEKDVLRLENRLFRWAENLRKWRNTHAHRYGLRKGSVRALRHADLARRFTACGRLMNNLRLLVDGTAYLMSPLEPSKNDTSARDLVDIIVIGSIEFALDEISKEEGQYSWQKRTAYYARLHRRRRRKRTDSFNRQE